VRQDSRKRGRRARRKRTEGGANVSKRAEGRCAGGTRRKSKRAVSFGDTVRPTLVPVRRVYRPRRPTSEGTDPLSGTHQAVPAQRDTVPRGTIPIYRVIAREQFCPAKFRRVTDISFHKLENTGIPLEEAHAIDSQIFTRNNGESFGVSASSRTTWQLSVPKGSRGSRDRSACSTDTPHDREARRMSLSSSVLSVGEILTVTRTGLRAGTGE